MYGFDFTYRGNHNQLLCDALGLPVAFESITQRPGSQVMCYEPVIQISLDDTFSTHARINFEPRNGSLQTKSPEFSEELLSVYVTIRRFVAATGKAHAGVDGNARRREYSQAASKLHRDPLGTLSADAQCLAFWDTSLYLAYVT
jgi:hypothetical protein